MALFLNLTFCHLLPADPSGIKKRGVEQRNASKPELEMAEVELLGTDFVPVEREKRKNK